MSAMSAIAAQGDAQRAAVMVMVLDEAVAASLLAQLDPAELRLLGESMIALGEIGPEAISHAIAGFVDHNDQTGLPSHDRPERMRALMKRAVGEVKADGLIQRILPDEAADTSALELARWLSPRVLVQLMRDEHPQAIAVLLVQLDPETAAQVLHGLPPESQAEIVHRIATLGPVMPEALGMIEDVLSARIGEVHGPSALSIGGPREAAEIINRAGKAIEKLVMPAMAKRDKQLARAIENEMFKFEHLFVLDAQAMGALLREVESEVLIDALKGIGEDRRELFFSAMSSRAADGVKDEIAARGRLKLADVEVAQRIIVAAARRLAAEGTIVFGSGGGEDDYV